MTTAQQHYDNLEPVAWTPAQEARIEKLTDQMLTDAKRVLLEHLADYVDDIGADDPEAIRDAALENARETITESWKA